MPITLATTHHDPEGRLIAQTLRVVPHIHKLFSTITVRLTSTTVVQAEEVLRAAGCEIVREDAHAAP